MTAGNIRPSKPWLRRPPLRVQLTVLYAGLFVLLVVAGLAVSGLLVRHGSATVGDTSPAALAVSGQRFDVGPLSVAVIAAIVAVGLAWWIAGWLLRPLRTMNAAAREI